MTTGVYGRRTGARKEMNVYLAALLIFISALLQTTLLARLHLFGVKPDLLLILTCFFLLHLSEKEALGAVFVMGLISDTYSLAPFGLTALSYLLVATILLRTREEMVDTNLFTWSLVLAGATLFNGLLLLVVLRLLLWEPLPVLDFFGKLLLSALINAALGAVLLPLLSRLGGGRVRSSAESRIAETCHVGRRKGW